MNTKPMILRAFSISNSNIKKSESDIMDKLEEKLRGSVASDRRLPLRSEENAPEDLLSDYAINAGKYIYGVMLRLVQTKEIKNIPDDLFSHPKIQIDEISSKETKTGVSSKDHFYFALNNSFLVTDLPAHRTIKSLQTYLNWLTEALRGDVFYEINPKISNRDIKLSSIKRITVADPNAKKGKNTIESGDTSNKVITLAKNAIGAFFDTVPDMDKIIEKNILSARLVVSFSKPKKMTDEDYQKALGACMKPIGDAENVEFVTNRGNKIKGKDVLLTKSVDIDLLDNGSLNEQTIIGEMAKYLVELKNS